MSSPEKLASSTLHTIHTAYAIANISRRALLILLARPHSPNITSLHITSEAQKPHTHNNSSMPPPPQNHLSSPAKTGDEPVTTITTTEELTRFARYVEFRTRDFRNSVQTFLGANPTTEPEQDIFHETEEEDEGLFVEVGRFDDEFSDWVGVTDDAVDCPEVRFLLSFLHINRLLERNSPMIAKTKNIPDYHPCQTKTNTIPQTGAHSPMAPHASPSTSAGPNRTNNPRHLARSPARRFTSSRPNRLLPRTRFTLCCRGCRVADAHREFRGGGA